MQKYYLRVDRISAPKQLELIMEYDTDNLETIYSILWQNSENWKDKIINVYDAEAEDGVIYHYPVD